MDRKSFTVLGAVGVLVGAFAVGTAFAKDGTNTIHGCVNESSGVLRVVADPADCRRAESVLNWNVQGVPGQDGAEGPVGADGAEGPVGGAVAYAHVKADGTIDSDSGNIAVSRVANGTYCVGVTGATVNVGVASLDGRIDTGGSVAASILGIPSGCPAAQRDLFVITREHSRDGGFPGQDRAFYIIIN